MAVSYKFNFFYFQLFNGAIPEKRLTTLMTNQAIKNLIHVIESHFQLQFSKKQKHMLSLHLHILQQRLDYRKMPKREISEDMLRQIEQDHFYQELDNIFKRFLSRFALAASGYEAVYLYLFFITEGLLPQTSQWWKKNHLLFSIFFNNR